MSSIIAPKSQLRILVSLNGLSFYSTGASYNNVNMLKNISFSSSQRVAKIEDLLNDVFNNNAELVQKYDQVLVVHSNNLSTFVPTEIFDEDYLGSYLQYNTKVFETDFFAFDAMPKHQMNSVYIPYINMNNFFIDFYGSFNYQHASTILVSKLLDLKYNDDSKIMYVHVADAHFEIVIIQEQSLILYNSFDYKNPEDFIYFILFTAEQLHLNPDNFELKLIGFIDQNDELYQICYKYIRNVSFLEIDSSLNNLTELENRHHFILLNS